MTHTVQYNDNWEPVAKREITLGKLLSEQDAIQQAVEVGYVSPDRLAEGTPLYFVDTVLSDPAFWQALGKARGWTGVVFHGYMKDGADHLEISHYLPRWQYIGLRYFEVKLSGGDLNQFWTSLP
jgi:hypothetical protein